MDLQQRKLNKSEWDSIEVPVTADEMEVLHLIRKGFHNVNIKYNKSESLFSYLKMEVTKEMADYLYGKYFADTVNRLADKYQIRFLQIKMASAPFIKKADLIRLQKNTVESLQKADIYEFVLLDVVERLFASQKTPKKESEWLMYYYTLYKLLKNNIAHINSHIVDVAQKILSEYESAVSISDIITNASPFIEKNPWLNRYNDMQLYQHQKEIFTICKRPDPKLVLYIAPTGTGKTLTPIGLSEQHRIIFVCAARHVGLALAKAGISVNKKVAFAFGCSSSGDIRLHYFAAKEITVNRRTGGIWKVDNSVGDKVEIMICDIKSYLPAMYYMLAFNADTEIITYWDEPTITMDYANHEFHAIIQKNWSENKIPHMVLSSATLPKLHELGETVADFKEKFPGANVFNIVSHDCRKSIPIVNKHGYVVLPHNLHRDYAKMRESVRFCLENATLLRYFDLSEVVVCLEYILSAGWVSRTHQVERYFETLDDLTVIQLKVYYLKLLSDLSEESWYKMYDVLYVKRLRKVAANEFVDPKGNRITKSVSIGPGTSVAAAHAPLEGKPLMRLSSVPAEVGTTPLKTEAPDATAITGIYITTKDAFTLTDGPTIFLATDVEKVAKFCVQQANIPAKVMEDIVEKINFNNGINDKISVYEKSIEDVNERRENETKNAPASDKKKMHKLDRGFKDDDVGGNKDTKRLLAEMEVLRSMIKITKLNDAFVPNTSLHMKKWAEEFHGVGIPAFKSDIDDETIVKIMLLKNVADSWKVLLLMGIGVFTNHESIEYTEIMKNLADQQKLYLIIASSDYIYGTNYQFCHGYISKDATMTQEKIIQSMGRVGRNKMHQDYTIRFRDDEQIVKIFTHEVDKPEVTNMNRLFTTME